MSIASRDRRATAVVEARQRAAANHGLGVAFVEHARGTSDRRGWAGEIVAVDGESERWMLVVTEQRPPYAKVVGRRLAEALERISNAAATDDRVGYLSVMSSGPGIRMDALVDEDEFLAIFPW